MKLSLPARDDLGARLKNRGSQILEASRNLEQPKWEKAKIGNQMEGRDQRK